MGNFRESEREKADFDQTIEAGRILKSQARKLKAGLFFMIVFLAACILTCAYFGVQT